MFEGDTLHSTTEVDRQAHSKSRPDAGNRRIPSPCLQPGRQAGGRVPPQRLHPHAARPEAPWFAAVRPADAPRSSTRRSAAAPTRSSSISRISRTGAQGGRARSRREISTLSPASRAPRPQPARAGQRARRPGLTDADLDAIVPAQAGRHHAAEGGRRRDIMHADAKLTAREALHGLPGGAIGIVAIATETAQSLFLAGTYRAASPRLTGLTWGAEDLSAESAPRRTATPTALSSTPIGSPARSASPRAAAAEVLALDTVYVDFRNAPACAGNRAGRRDGFQGKMAIHPAQVPPSTTCSPRSPRRSRGSKACRRRLRGRARSGRRRDRRRDVRSSASRQGAAPPRPRKGGGGGAGRSRRRRRKRLRLSEPRGDVHRVAAQSGCHAAHVSSDPGRAARCPAAGIAVCGGA